MKLSLKAFRNRPIVVQIIAVTLLCQLLAHIMLFVFAASRMERPETYNAIQPTTASAVALAGMIQNAPEAQRATALVLASNAGIGVSLVSSAAYDLKRLEIDDDTAVVAALARVAPNLFPSLREVATTGPDRQLAFDLGQGQALLFAPGKDELGARVPYVLMTFVFFGLVLSLVAFTVWSIHMLTSPLRSFATMADRFAIDLDPTPLPANGPAEIRTLALAFNAMRDRIRGLMESRSRMLAAVGHDLRTPLTRIRLRAEALPESEDQQRILRDVVAMNEMISQVLSYLRDQASNARPERVDLGAFLETICDDFGDMGRQVTLSGPRHVVANVEPELLSRAVSNLIDNATKFGTHAEVTLALPSPAEVTITVDDDGPGIPNDQKAMAFEPFSRGDSARSHPEDGFGLGLAIARQIVERHGGAITLHDRTPNGLSARISLPVFGGQQIQQSPISEAQASKPRIIEAM
jgi:signal transduction histidine kinase